MKRLATVLGVPIMHTRSTLRYRISNTLRVCTTRSPSKRASIGNSPSSKLFRHSGIGHRARAEERGARIKLTDPQLAHFEEYGCVIAENVLDDDDLDPVIRDYSDHIDRRACALMKTSPSDNA